MRGTLRMRARNGYTLNLLPAAIDLCFGTPVPTAVYRIGDETFRIEWHNGEPRYTFSHPALQPDETITGTSISWNDISLAFLWWPNARRIGVTKKINRACHLLEIPVPGQPQIMRLWIDKNMGMLIEAQTLNDTGEILRTLKIKRIKKISEVWMVKTFEALDHTTGYRTFLRINDLKISSAPSEDNL